LQVRQVSVGLIGFGAIGSVLAGGLRQRREQARIAGVLVRPGREAEVAAELGPDTLVVTSLAALLDLGPGLVVECAGQGAVADYAREVLAHGTDLMIVSTGALARPGFLEELTATAAGSDARLIIPAGAIAGLDGLGALKGAGLASVTYTSTKPPLAWRGTRAEALLDLENLQERTVFFEGSAREAATSYPKNANLAATVGLAGLGLDETRVRLVADPAATGNTGAIEASSDAGDLRVTMSGRPSGNPKTSASTAYSLLHAVLSRGATLVI
jgi:aspartate dehydrogenase